jgi:hypothetical protein
MVTAVISVEIGVVVISGDVGGDVTVTVSVGGG